MSRPSKKAKSAARAPPQESARELFTSSPAVLEVPAAAFESFAEFFDERIAAPARPMSPLMLPDRLSLNEVSLDEFLCKQVQRFRNELDEAEFPHDFKCNHHLSVSKVYVENTDNPRFYYRCEACMEAVNYEIGFAMRYPFCARNCPVCVARTKVAESRSILRKYRAEKRKQ